MKVETAIAEKAPQPEHPVPVLAEPWPGPQPGAGMRPGGRTPAGCRSPRIHPAWAAVTPNKTPMRLLRTPPKLMLTRLWEETLEARRAMNQGSSVAVPDTLLRARQ